MAHNMCLYVFGFSNFGALSKHMHGALHAHSLNTHTLQKSHPYTAPYGQIIDNTKYLKNGKLLHFVDFFLVLCRENIPQFNDL